LAHVVGRQFLGHITELDLEVDGISLRARVPGMAPDSTEIRIAMTSFRTVPNDL